MLAQLSDAPGPLIVDGTADVVAQINGNFGFWQLRTILLVLLCQLPAAWFMACVIYAAPASLKGDYYCQPNGTMLTAAWVRRAQPAIVERPTDRRFHVAACHSYEAALELNFAAHFAANYANPFRAPPPKAAAMPCDQFEQSAEYKSLWTQLDSVCSRELLVAVTQSFHALGAVGGGLLAHKALKHTSPRRLLLLGMLGQLVCGNLTGLVASFRLHVYFRCLTALCSALVYTGGRLILVDITGGQARTIVLTLFDLYSSVGLILLPGLATFFDSWSDLYVAISASHIIFVILHRWIAEAPRWLLRHQKIDRAVRILRESATFNDRALPPNLEAQLQQYARLLGPAAERSLPGYWSIWEGQTARRQLCGVHCAWLLATVLQNVMLLMVRSLGVAQLHGNTARLGCAELLGLCLGLYLLLYTRRCWLWVGYLLMAAGGLTFLVWTQPQSIEEQRRVGFHMIFWICLRLANAASLAVLNGCTAQLVSSEKGALLLLSVATFSRLGLIAGSYISVLSVNTGITILASLSLLNGGLMCLLDSNFPNAASPRVLPWFTPHAYCRNSANVLLRRCSNCSDWSADGHDNLAHSISIAELQCCGTALENESATELERATRKATTTRV